jgi:hypothetical protein
MNYGPLGAACQPFREAERKLMKKLACRAAAFDYHFCLKMIGW